MGEGSLFLRTHQQAGFTAFVLATVSSLLLGHVALYMHEQDPGTRLDNARRLARLQTGTGPALRTLLRRPCTLQEIHLQLSARERPYVAVILMITSFMCALGCL